MANVLTRLEASRCTTHGRAASGTNLGARYAGRPEFADLRFQEYLNGAAIDGGVSLARHGSQDLPAGMAFVDFCES